MLNTKVATLKNEAYYTLFSHNGYTIKFRTSRHLEKYTKILEWNHGYLVVMAKYDTSSEAEEEYIDLVPILKNLYIDPDEFLNNIEEVHLQND